MILRTRVCVANAALGKFMLPPYPLVTSNRGVHPSESRARKRSSEPFVFCRVRNREAAGYPTRVYLLTAWMVPSGNFALTEFSRVRAPDPASSLRRGSGDRAVQRPRHRVP